MRLVILSEVDMEPMTIVEVPLCLREYRSGDVIRLLPRMEFPEWGPHLMPEPVRTVTIRLELLRHYLGGEIHSTWIGFAQDDGLELKSALLPGQMADYAWELV